MPANRDEPIGETARAFSAHFAHVEELRCQARKALNGTLDEVSRPEQSSMGIFYCQRHGSYHGYSFHKFRLVVVKARDAYLAQHREAMVSEIGSKALALLIERHNSTINEVFRIDHARYVENHRRLQHQDRVDRVASLMEGLGVTAELVDEFYICYRKQAHPTPAHAHQHLDSLMQSTNFSGGALEAYQCSYCTGWHVGHKTSGDGVLDELNRREKAIKYLSKGRGEVEAFYSEKGLALTYRAPASNRGGAGE